jgi:hypothetical protein
MNVSIGERSDIIVKITENYFDTSIASDVEERAAKLKFFLADEKVAHIKLCLDSAFKSTHCRSK